MRRQYPCTFLKACNCLWLRDHGCTQTQIAIEVELNVGTVNHVLRRHRYPMAFPVPIPGR